MYSIVTIAKPREIVRSVGTNATVVWPDGAENSHPVPTGTTHDKWRIYGHVIEYTGNPDHTRFDEDAPKYRSDDDQVIVTRHRKPAPPPAPDKASSDPEYSRKAQIRRHGPQAYELADAVVGWANRIRRAQDDINNATSISDLKTALSPVFDQPPVLDAIIAEWLAVRARFPE